MENITINKIEDRIITERPEVPVENVRYEVLIEETRKDEAGKDYTYTRKEYTTIEQLDNQIAQLTEQLAVLKGKKDLINKLNK